MSMVYFKYKVVNMQVDRINLQLYIYPNNPLDGETQMSSPKPYLYTDNNNHTIDDYAVSIQRLKRPYGDIDVVLDTDMYNEVDDQFALAYLLKSPQLHLKGIFAAPFSNHNSQGPLDGMEKSYDEILHMLKLLGQEQYKEHVYKGAGAFLCGEDTPVDTPAARQLIHLSEGYSTERPLYVIGIAACTNIASALLLCPEMRERIFVVWLGGMSFEWHDNASFNAGQDIAAARVLLGSGVPLVLLPGRGVLDHFTTTGPELDYWLKGKNAFCDYMLEKTVREAQRCSNEKCWSRPISDVAAVAWLLGNNFMLDRLEPSPVMEYDNLYSQDKRRLFIRYVYSINRDRLMGDLFDKLASY